MSANVPAGRFGADGIPTLPISELYDNAHEIYRHFRGKIPFIMAETGVCLILRGDDILSLYNDTMTRQAETDLLTLRGINDGPIWDFFSNGMLHSNGDVHRRRRAPMTRTFAFKMITALRPYIRQTVNEIIDSFVEKGEMEFLEDFATPVPARIIASILGLPKEDIQRFTDIVYRLTPVLTGSYKLEDVPHLQRAVGDLRQYVEEIFNARRLAKSNDFLGEYIATADESGALSPDEAIAQLMTLIIGGSDTTRSALVIQLAALLANPDQWKLLVENPDMVPSAVSECLRYEPSVGSLARVTIDDIELDGQVLPAKRPCYLVTMSALRDETWYKNPERLDITRPQPKWHPVFGGGAHRCLGEALARAELEESLAVLVQRFPDIKAKAAYPKVFGFSGIRTVEAFPVILGRAR